MQAVFKSCKSAYTVQDCKGANLNLMSCDIFLIIYGFCLKKVTYQNERDNMQFTTKEHFCKVKLRFKLIKGL